MLRVGLALPHSSCWLYDVEATQQLIEFSIGRQSPRKHVWPSG